MTPLPLSRSIRHLNGTESDCFSPRFSHVLPSQLLTLCSNRFLRVIFGLEHSTTHEAALARSTCQWLSERGYNSSSRLRGP